MHCVITRNTYKLTVNKIAQLHFIFRKWSHQSWQLEIVSLWVISTRYNGQIIGSPDYPFVFLLASISDPNVQLSSNETISMLIYFCFVYRCWSLKFKQSDHQFLHQSNVFHHINNILSKSDDGDSEENFNISVQSGYEALNQVQQMLMFLNRILLIKSSIIFLFNWLQYKICPLFSGPIYYWVSIWFKILLFIILFIET